MASSSTSPKFLAVFDFDHTVMDDNTDTAVMDIGGHKIPDEVKAVAKVKGWTAHMQAVFLFLHSKEVTEQQYYDRLEELPFTPGMKELLGGIDDLGGESIIISDSNSIFIKRILDKNGLNKSFKEVYTNPAKFDADGSLKISPYHHNDDCKLSGSNLCKGRVMTTYLNKRKEQDKVEYPFVCYMGDGSNDFCPMLRLRNKDLAFTRTGNKYSIDSVISKRATQGMKIRATRVEWSDGHTILNAIKKQMPK